MSDWKLGLYHKLPHTLKNLAASLRGYQLRSWRYSPKTDALVEAALARDSWTAEQWKSYQEERLAFLLHRARHQVPYYRNLWDAKQKAGDKASFAYLENWPVLEKENLRQNPLAFLAEDCDPKTMLHEATSGTTGKPIELWWSKEVAQAWYALVEARWRRWYGLSREDRWAILGGQLIVPVENRRPPFWVWNQAFNQLYMSSYHLAPDLISHYLKALEDYQVTYIYAYTSSVYSLAQEILKAKVKPKLQIRLIMTNAEPLYQHQRETLEAAFNCPVHESYGMSEIVIGASECEHGRMHLWPDAGYTELQDDTVEETVDLRTGELLCTGLLNADMPLIRYKVGDHASFPRREESCACGRKLPQLAAVEGRHDDMLYTPDGRKIGRLDPVFKSSLPIREAQIIQESLSQIRVLYVPDKAYKAEDGESIIDRLQQRMGLVEVKLEAVDAIPRTKNGKFRAVISKLSAEERSKVQNL